MNIKDRVQLFYQHNTTTLSAFYPGLTLHRLLQEFYELPHFGLGTFEEFCQQSEFFLSHDSFQSFFRGLIMGTPIEYMTGKCYFYQNNFLVYPGVFIPRSETEILVDEVRNEIKKRHRLRPYTTENPLKIVDVCLGTGCVLLSVISGLDFPIEAIGIDIDDRALSNSYANYQQLKYNFGPYTQCRFLKGDRLDQAQSAEMIISNPPYIKSSQAPDIHPQVLKYEPNAALFLPDENYQSWFEVFFSQVKETLTEDGLFFMEGHEFHLQNLAELGTKIGFSYGEILQDLTGRDRFYRAKVKKN